MEGGVAPRPIQPRAFNTGFDNIVPLYGHRLRNNAPVQQRSCRAYTSIAYWNFLIEVRGPSIALMADLDFMMQFVGFGFIFIFCTTSLKPLDDANDAG